MDKDREIDEAVQEKQEMKIELEQYKQ